MSSLNEFNQRRRELLEQYDAICTLGLADGRIVSQDEVQKRKEDLSAERFTVSVCGQMNVGKSSLLNTWLFDDRILPTSATSMTAKLTVLRYAEKLSLEVEYYTREEWKDLEESYKSADSAHEGDLYMRLMEDVECCQRTHGVYFEECVASTMRCDRIPDIDRLADFVVAPRKGGKYSPFVRKITLNAPAEVLKSITVVDTPGLNDPNPIRSRITEQYMRESDAIIYMMSATRTCDSSDVDFMTSALQSIASSHLLLVVNKCDAVERLDSVKSYMESLKTDPKAAIRAVFNSEQPPVFVSSLAGYILKRRALGLPLDAAAAAQAEMLEESDHLDPEFANMDSFRQMVEARLIRNKGRRILSSHGAYLSGIFDRHISQRTIDLEDKREILADLSNEETDFDNQRRKEQENIHTANGLFDEFEEQFESNMDEIEINFKRSIKEFKKKAECAVKEKIDEAANASDLKKNIPWDIRSAIEDHLFTLSDSFGEAKSELRQTLKSRTNDLQLRLMNDLGLSIGKVKAVSEITLSSIYDRLESALGMDELRKAIHQSVEENASIWHSFGWDMQDLKSTVYDRTKLILQGSFNRIGQIFQEIREYFKQSLKQCRDKYNQSLSAKECYLEDLKKQVTTRKEQREVVMTEIRAFEKCLAELKHLKGETLR